MVPGCHRRQAAGLDGVVAAVVVLVPVLNGVDLAAAAHRVRDVLLVRPRVREAERFGAHGVVAVRVPLASHPHLVLFLDRQLRVVARAQRADLLDRPPLDVQVAAGGHRHRFPRRAGPARTPPGPGSRCWLRARTPRTPRPGRACPAQPSLGPTRPKRHPVGRGVPDGRHRRLVKAEAARDQVVLELLGVERRILQPPGLSRRQPRGPQPCSVPPLADPRHRGRLGLFLAFAFAGIGSRSAGPADPLCDIVCILVPHAEQVG